MRIEEIIWLDIIIEKLAVKHWVEPDEVEEVLRNQPKFRFLEKGDHKEKDVYLALEKTMQVVI
ncbi:hypothetical protein OOK60_16740 [Trichothermofontia sichuanensis B231]|uniref:hypothetical protein n=1 Tax=Trichothermofontia sichuanensis TaxID=3045816 RepID=UPI0022479FCC|nr:hypothetical protein [Trichothermofontia sichuanensis]UZQ54113.1 hypothetical protein OOK60_16740 [Trichothermofontia sichuanensis B231]